MSTAHYMREVYAARKEERMCVDCGADCYGRKARCLRCRVLRAVKARRYRARKVAA